MTTNRVYRACRSSTIGARPGAVIVVDGPLGCCSHDEIIDPGRGDRKGKFRPNAEQPEAGRTS